MALFKIKKNLEFNTYVLDVVKPEENENLERTYTLQLEFYGVDKPSINSYLFLNNKLLDRNSSEFTQPYSFELSNKKVTKEDFVNPDFAVLKINKKNYILKRIYG